MFSAPGAAFRLVHKVPCPCKGLARLTACIRTHSAVYPESHFCSVDMSFLFVPAYCPRKSWGAGQFAQHLFVLRRNWTAFQIFQELAMVPNFQIIQVIEYIHPTLHVRTPPQNDGNLHAVLVVHRDSLAEILRADKKFLVVAIVWAQCSIRSSTWFQTCLG